MNAINFFNYNIMDFKAENDTRTALKQLMKVYHETAHLRGGSRITGSLNTKVHYIEYSDEQETMIVICNTSALSRSHHTSIKSISTKRTGEYRVLQHEKREPHL